MTKQFGTSRFREHFNVKTVILVVYLASNFGAGSRPADRKAALHVPVYTELKGPLPHSALLPDQLDHEEVKLPYLFRVTHLRITPLLENCSRKFTIL